MKGRPKLPDDIKELITLVRAGKLFAVQKWIADGKRTTPPEPYWNSPLRVAMEIGFHSMVEVLLKTEIPQKDKDAALRSGVWHNEYDFVLLLVEHGADPKTIDFKHVCESGNPAMISFFLDHGADAITGHPFAVALKNPKRPMLRFFLSYREKIPELQYQVNLALKYHANKGSMMWVCLLLWAGADPYVPLPEIGNEPDPEMDSSALDDAILNDHEEIAEKIGIDLKRVDAGKLIHRACFRGMWPLIEKLLDSGVDPNSFLEHEQPIEGLLWHLQMKMDPYHRNPSDYEVDEALKLVLQYADRGGRWLPKDGYRFNSFRRSMYKLRTGKVEKIIGSFLRHQVCSILCVG